MEVEIPAILWALFGPIGVMLGIIAYIAYMMFKFMGKFDNETNHNQGTSIKDMLRDQRSLGQLQADYLKLVVEKQDVREERAGEAEQRAEEFREWTKEVFQEDEEDTLDQ